VLAARPRARARQKTWSAKHDRELFYFGKFFGAPYRRLTTALEMGRTSLRPYWMFYSVANRGLRTRTRGDTPRTRKKITLCRGVFRDKLTTSKTYLYQLTLAASRRRTQVYIRGTLRNSFCTSIVYERIVYERAAESE